MFIPRFPLHFVFILSNRCNLACIHCSSDADSCGTFGYTTAEAAEVLDQMAALGVVDVALSGGEPLLRRDLSQLVAYARGLGMTVGTSTNGYPLTSRNAAKLRDADLTRLQVSLDGTQQMHDRIRGKGAFRKAVEAIGRSLDHGLQTHICFTAMRMNAHLLPEMLELARRLGVHGFNLSQFVPTGRGTRDQGITPQTSRDLLEIWLAARKRFPDMYLSAHAAGLAALEPAAVDCRGGCQAGMSIGCITAQGDVTPCVMFPLALGNLRRRALRGIWEESDVVAKLKSREVGGACGACRYRETCGGCRAAAWVVDGDMMAEDPYCWIANPPATPATGRESAADAAHHHLLPST